MGKLIEEPLKIIFIICFVRFLFGSDEKSNKNFERSFLRSINTEKDEKEEEEEKVSRCLSPVIPL